MEKLEYWDEDRFAGIPENEKNLQTISAVPFMDIDMEGVVPGLNILEGVCFDRNGMLFVCNTPMGRIYKIDPSTKEISMFADMPGYFPSSVTIHKDGRIFVTMAGSPTGPHIAVFSPEGKRLENLLENTTHIVDDMVFDSKGGFYFTDLGGTIADPSAGVFYVEPDMKTIHPVIESGMIASNGIALTPDESCLWITEYGRNKLHHFALEKDGYTLSPSYSYIPYYFTGMEGPDSCCIDADGNLIVSMCGQGRFMLFNPNGLPMAQILIPGREKGQMLKSTHPAIRPGINEIYMCTADLNTGKSGIYVAEGFAPAYKSYCFQ